MIFVLIHAVATLVRFKQGHFLFEHTMSSNSAAVVRSALDGATPTLGLSIAGGQGRYGVVVDENGLGVVAGRVVEFV